ncbi:hypothetical protein X772_27380 [Mesorhizobium sp. LSJC280B00]|nr:hypothetical protein X772_27380 [Mesorhizobium sp. LSJC280B00]
MRRQERSRAIVADLEPWLREKLGLISHKTKLAETIRYTLTRWEGLSRFLDDGRIEIDSNTVERDRTIDARLQQLHGSAVPQNMGRQSVRNATGRCPLVQAWRRQQRESGDIRV